MLQQLKNFLVRPIANPAIEGLYRICVAQARQPGFYASHEVPDTVEGRFDLLILHVLLVIGRLKDHADDTQQLFDILFADMDKNLRQMGVSDISIAKKMKPMLAAFYGRARAYEDALAADDHAVTEVLHKNIYGGKEVAASHVSWLKDYVRHTHQSLASQDTMALLEGKLTFPVVPDGV